MEILFIILPYKIKEVHFFRNRLLSVKHSGPPGGISQRLHACRLAAQPPRRSSPKTLHQHVFYAQNLSSSGIHAVHACGGKPAGSALKAAMCFRARNHSIIKNSPARKAELCFLCVISTKQMQRQNAGVKQNGPSHGEERVVRAGSACWPARRDSNPRPSESESAAISSFATGGNITIVV